jgi:hypothetical protein
LSYFRRAVEQDFGNTVHNFPSGRFFLARLTSGIGFKTDAPVYGAVLSGAEGQ